MIYISDICFKLKKYIFTKHNDGIVLYSSCKREYDKLHSM